MPLWIFTFSQRAKNIFSKGQWNVTLLEAVLNAETRIITYLSTDILRYIWIWAMWRDSSCMYMIAHPLHGLNGDLWHITLHHHGICFWFCFRVCRDSCRLFSSLVDPTMGMYCSEVKHTISFFIFVCNYSYSYMLWTRLLPSPTNKDPCPLRQRLGKLHFESWRRGPVPKRRWNPFHAPGRNQRYLQGQYSPSRFPIRRARKSKILS